MLLLCVFCLLVSVQDTLWWWRWAQTSTSVASASSSIIISRSFSPISKMDAPCPPLTHQPPLQQPPSLVKHSTSGFIVNNLHADLIYSLLLSCTHVPVLLRFQRRVCFRGNLPDLCYERCQKDPDQSTENTFQKIKTFPDFKETQLLFLRLVPLAVYDCNTFLLFGCQAGKTALPAKSHVISCYLFRTLLD